MYLLVQLTQNTQISNRTQPVLFDFNMIVK